jgi:predicted dehydrogenase
MPPPSNRKIRWGVPGYARIARECVMPAIARSANSELAALASRNETNLAEARVKFGPCRTHAGYEALLRDPEIDAVYIPLPNSLQHECVLRAAGHGKHVLWFLRNAIVLDRLFAAAN